MLLVRDAGHYAPCLSRQLMFSTIMLFDDRKLYGWGENVSHNPPRSGLVIGGCICCVSIPAISLCA